MGKNKSPAGDPASVTIPRQRILIAEDDPEIRKVNAEVLIHSGYHVDTAEDGAAAWDALQLNNYDLLITDNDMPKVSGVELVQKLLDANMSLSVIIATGALPPEDEFTRNPWLRSSIILLKPYRFDELLTTVREVLCLTSDARNELAPPPNWQIQPLANRFHL